MHKYNYPDREQYCNCININSATYKIKITDENRDKMPVVPQSTMEEAECLFGEQIDKMFRKK